jgi:hypothetical protein
MFIFLNRRRSVTDAREGQKDDSLAEEEMGETGWEKGDLMGDGSEVLVEMGSGVGVMKDEKCAGCGCEAREGKFERQKIITIMRVDNLMV